MLKLGASLKSRRPPLPEHLDANLVSPARDIDKDICCRPLHIRHHQKRPSQPPALPGAVWWPDVFSFPVMCMFLLAAVIFRYSARGIAEPDIWWHLRNARTLLQFHSFPRMDTYSFSAAGSPWINFEWLSEVPFFLGFKAMGLQGILAVYFAVLVLIYVGVYYRSCRAGADCKDAAVATLGAICLGGVSMAPRMLLFGWLCMVGLLLVLDRFRRTGKGLWLLPPLFALWINLHGSWVFGMVVLVLTIASGLVEGEWGLVVARRWTSGELKKLLLALAASLAALFVNPFGYKLVLYPFDASFPPARRYAVHRRVAACGLQHRQWQTGAGPDLRLAGGRLVLAPPLEIGRGAADGVCSVGGVVACAVLVLRRPDPGADPCATSEAVSTLRAGAG